MMPWPNLLAATVRKRIFGGFAVVLLLLAITAAVAERGMDAVGAGAGRLSQDSLQARASAEVALLVADARARIVQYALSATMDDQKAAQASLTELGQAISAESDLRPLAARFRTAVDASIAAVQARRSGVEQMQGAITELHAIVSAITEHLDTDADPGLIIAAARLADTFGATQGAASMFVATRTPAEANAAESALQAFRAALAALDAASTGNRRMQRLLKGMAEPLDRFDALLKQVVAADEQLRIATEARDVASVAVLKAAAAQRARAVDSQDAAMAAMLADTGSARRLTLLTAGSAIGVGLLLAWLIGGGIARPIVALTAVMHALSKGMLEIAIPNTDRHDELGQMARAVLVFKDNAVAIRRLQMEQEQARAQAEIEKRTALAKMADTIETETSTVLDQIRKRTAGMTATADAMSASANRTGAAAESAATATGQAMTNAQSVAGAAEQLSASIREIGGQMTQSAAVVSRAVSAGGATRATIEALNQQIGQIGAVADMIGAIAAKTNLLALNATIEAARAGDAGKGFAVVAAEVKALATQTARSTQDIGRHISQVRAATGASVAAVSRIEQTIAEVSAISGAIAAAVEQQGAATAEIARAVTATAAAADEMSLRTAEVAAEAGQTGRQATEVHDSATSLDHAVEDLRRSVIRVVRTATTEVDRRAGPRHAIDLPCRLTIAGRTYGARVLDLSETGARVCGAPDLPAGANGSVTIDGVGPALPFIVEHGEADTLGLAFTPDPAIAAAFRQRLAELTGRRAA
jgi:methyl-accepting chemotaxis protein